MVVYFFLRTFVLLNEKTTSMKKINILEWENTIRDAVINKGEQEQDTGWHRFWVSNLNGVVDIDGHTDILSVLVDNADCVLVQVNTPDDNSVLFEPLNAIPYKVVKEILNQVTE